MQGSKRAYMVWLAMGIIALCSCSRKLISTHYYTENQVTITQIENAYRALYAIRPFSVEFTDRSFSNISIEIMTDSIKYIYAFGIQEPRLRDTLQKYGAPVAGIMDMIGKMKSIKCIWINRLDYYANNQKNTLVYMSFRNVAIHLPFTTEKYYILTFYSQPQYYDADGQLLQGQRLRRVRRINGETFRRINDKVCYTISGKFR
ncbi:hypothetical protein [Sediminibacterium soli]|uniref:hypothetical protein n=1 Tax=Sediminibacterium soli TaxID=2698829 RepID=UPI001379EACE|nr:hypothetical protein [Sediminibacterium soli]NCI46630.1 hypothetical protein [Sediminibacterium soli]